MVMSRRKEFNGMETEILREAKPCLWKARPRYLGVEVVVRNVDWKNFTLHTSCSLFPRLYDMVHGLPFD